MMEIGFKKQYDSVTNRDLAALACPAGNTSDYCVHLSPQKEAYVDYVQDYLYTIAATQSTLNDFFDDLGTKYDIDQRGDFSLFLSTWTPGVLLLILSGLPVYFFIRRKLSPKNINDG